jgi:hypothetical protein
LTGISSGTSITGIFTSTIQNLTFTSISSGSTTGLGVSASGLVYNPSTNSLGIGTTNPRAPLDVTSSIRVSAGAASTFDVTIKTYTNESGSLSFENSATGASLLTLQQSSDDILFDVSTSSVNQIFKVGIDSSIVVSSGVASRDFKIIAYPDELGSISFESAVNDTQYFSITQNISTLLFGVNDASLNPVFTVNADSSTNVRLGSVAEKLSIINGNTVTLSYGSTTGTNIGVCTNPSGDITLNVNNIPTTSDFDNCSIIFSVFILQGATARKVSSINLNGVSKTIRWPGGITGTGNTSCYDIFNFVGINTIGSASTTSNYEVLGQVNEDFRLY